MLPKRYLGDGVYVEFDGFALVLTAENGIRATDSIVLEPDVWTALAQYISDLEAEHATPPDLVNEPDPRD